MESDTVSERLTEAVRSSSYLDIFRSLSWMML